GGRSVVLYWLGRRERDLMQRGMAMVARVFLAAGAREVYPALHGHRVVRNGDDLERMERARTAAADYLLTAFHPLGTCRMATEPGRRVVSPNHEVFGVPGLYVADGSVVPSSVAVNPQVTIMALATRAADLLAVHLDSPTRGALDVQQALSIRGARTLNVLARVVAKAARAQRGRRPVGLQVPGGGLVGVVVIVYVPVAVGGPRGGQKLHRSDRPRRTRAVDAT